MQKDQLIRLMTLLEVPSSTYEEHTLVTFISKYLDQRVYSYEIDTNNNIFITKGDAQYYPLVTAHLDTVHPIEPIKVEEEINYDAVGSLQDVLTGYSPISGESVGIGADDKSGIHICLELLNSNRIKNLKVAFFVEEECGCNGSKGAESTFFDDIGYAIMFDSPEGNTMSLTLMNQPLFDIDGDFITICAPLLYNFGITEWQHHSYTDVMVLRERFGFATLNIAAGYYRYHTPQEYLVLSDVSNAIKLGETIIGALGEDLYS